MGHIFISYSKKDIVYAEQLINALRREGFNPWLDRQGFGDKGVLPGSGNMSLFEKEVERYPACHIREL